ncbi:twitching motility protein PilT [bacterium]|nr:MAG: twitching motility protein PilT [bacterium]
MPGVTYDTGALVAAERNDRRMWALHAGFLAGEVVPTVPAPVLAEAWRGGPRQASLARFLALCVVEAMSEGQAKDVGVLVGRSSHRNIVDVAVVEGAIRRGDGIVTSDPRDVQHIVDAARARVTIATI